MRPNIKRIGRRTLQKINRALTPIDKLFILQNSNCPPPLFIMGIPRSGTTLAYQIISYQFQVAYFSPIMEYFYGVPNFQFRLYKAFLKKRPQPVFQSNYGRVKGLFAPAETGPIWSRWFLWNDDNSHHLQEDVNVKVTEYYKGLKQNMDSIAAIMQKPLLIKSVYLTMLTSLLAQLFPEARFVHIRRNMLLNIQSLFIGRLKQSDPTEWWSVKPPQFKQIQQKKLWQQVVEQAFFTEKILTDELAQAAPKRTFDIEYERLCRQPHQVMEELGDWLGDDRYKPYPTSDLPVSFSVSNKLVLNQELLDNMSQYFKQLECKN